MTEITPDVARKILEAARIKKLKACQAELNALLEKHGCKMICQIVIVDGRIVGNVLCVESA